LLQVAHREEIDLEGQDQTDKILPS
jgi:hypothetical protein